MPRKPNKKCVACAQLTAHQARQVHGSNGGDGCWVEKRCPRRRSHYRNRLKLNEQRRQQYRQDRSGQQEGQGGKQIESISLPVNSEVQPYANLYLWRERRKDAPLHAIAASVFQDGEKVLEVKPIHCAGYRRRDLERYVQKDIMGYLTARFGITFFSDEIRLEPVECPIPGCPLGDRLNQSEVNDG